MNMLIRFKIIVRIDLLSYIWPLILFKILFQICKIISHDSIFSDKMNNNKTYVKILFFNKTNDQTQLKNQL
jgi:hypothetical protein